MEKEFQLRMYRPHFNSVGAGSVVEGHRRYLEDKEIDTLTPEEMWEDDLREHLKNELEECREILIAGDFNERLEMKSRTWTTMAEMHLGNIAQARYGHVIPSTRYPGDKSAIDHIFASEGLRPQKVEILEFRHDLSDHAPIISSFFGGDIFYAI